MGYRGLTGEPGVGPGIGTVASSSNSLEAQRARITAEAGPAQNLAKLFGSNDTEVVVRLVTALLVLVLDPLAMPLTLARRSSDRTARAAELVWPAASKKATLAQAGGRLPGG